MLVISILAWVIAAIVLGAGSGPSEEVQVVVAYESDGTVHVSQGERPAVVKRCAGTCVVRIGNRSVSFTFYDDNGEPLSTPGRARSQGSYR
jgi:hypothetical protein